MLAERGTGSAEDVMYEEAERAYAVTGERHGYTGLTYGLAEVLRRLGVDTDWRELSSRLHTPLADFHSEFVLERVTLPQIATAVEATLSRGGAELPYEFRDLARGGAPWHLQAPEPSGLALGRVEGELSRHLKRERIRRGSRRYQEFVADNAARVVQRITKEGQRDIDEAARVAGALRDHVQTLRVEAVRNAEHAERQRTLRGGILEAADEEPSPETEQVLEEREAKWSAVLRQLDAIDASLDRVGEMDAEGYARGLMASSADLRPFLDALND